MCAKFQMLKTSDCTFRIAELINLINKSLDLKLWKTKKIKIIQYAMCAMFQTNIYIVPQNVYCYHKNCNHYKEPQQQLRLSHLISAL